MKKVVLCKKTVENTWTEKAKMYHRGMPELFTVCFKDRQYNRHLKKHGIVKYV